ncbi:hypothetical protein OJ998_35025 [Solirubrobacter taibaiensis]|nr:hypothetical protein [Solirubrobacter taibaiensis]
MKAYTVRRWRVSTLVPLVVMLVIFVGAPRLLGIDGFPIPFIAAFVGLLAWNGWRTSLVLKLDIGGVQLIKHEGSRTNSKKVAWVAIQETVLTESEPAIFFLRLKNGETPYELQVELPDANRSELAAAVEGLGKVPLRSS